MDLFGGADDISSGSDGEDKPPTPGQPIVRKITNGIGPFKQSSVRSFRGKGFSDFKRKKFIN